MINLGLEQPGTSCQRPLVTWCICKRGWLATKGCSTVCSLRVRARVRSLSSIRPKIDSILPKLAKSMILDRRFPYQGTQAKLECLARMKRQQVSSEPAYTCYLRSFRAESFGLFRRYETLELFEIAVLDIDIRIASRLKETVVVVNGIERYQRRPT